MEEEINFIEIIKYFWNKKIWIILIGIISVVLGVIYINVSITPQYKATASFVLTNDDFETEAEVNAYSKLPDRYFVIVSSKIVMENVIENLKLDIKDAIAFRDEHVEIKHFPENFLINVSVTMNDAKKAADIANEIVKVSLEEIKTIYGDENLKVVDEAVEDWKQINNENIAIIIKFVLVGEIVVCGFILIFYLFVEGNKKEKNKKMEEKEQISEEYLVKEKEILTKINKTKKYEDLVKKRKELEKNLTNDNYKLILEINDEILRHYAKEAYIEGYENSKSNNLELISK